LNPQLRQWLPGQGVSGAGPPPGAASAAFVPAGAPPTSAAAADSRPLAASLQAGRVRRGVQLDVTNLPGLEALTAKVGETLVLVANPLHSHRPGRVRPPQLFMV